MYLHEQGEGAQLEPTWALGHVSAAARPKKLLISGAHLQEPRVEQHIQTHWRKAQVSYRSSSVPDPQGIAQQAAPARL